MQNKNKEKKKIRNFIKENGAVKKIRGFIKENETIKKIRSLIKVNKPVSIAVTVLVCLILVGVSYTVYAKYYKTGFNKGMATASGFYFNSNYMAGVSKLKDINKPDSDIDISNLDPEILETIIVSANNQPWQEGEPSYNFHVEVRNYDNQLLYNDQDLNVEYEVNFMLLEDPQGTAFYEVSTSGQETQKLEWDSETGANIATFRGTLPGGAANADDYQLTVTMWDSENYKPHNILMVAYPIGPDYLLGTKAIAGIIRANYEEKEFNIERQEFVVSTTQPYQDDWGDAVSQESGYVYRVYTSGNFTGNGSATRRTIRVMWRSDMYEINKFDENYQKVKDDPTRYHPIDRGDDQQWWAMEIDVLPYSALNFVFYRKDGFVDILDEMIKAGDNTSGNTGGEGGTEGEGETGGEGETEGKIDAGRKAFEESVWVEVVNEED